MIAILLGKFKMEIYFISVRVLVPCVAIAMTNLVVDSFAQSVYLQLTGKRYVGYWPNAGLGFFYVQVI